MKYKAVIETDEYEDFEFFEDGNGKYIRGIDAGSQNNEWIALYFTECEQESVLDKIRAEIEDMLYVDSLIFGELIDFRNGKISADDVIEEFNRVTRLEVLKIIDKYKAESEGANGNI